MICSPYQIKITRLGGTSFLKHVCILTMYICIPSLHISVKIYIMILFFTYINFIEYFFNLLFVLSIMKFCVVIHDKLVHLFWLFNDSVLLYKHTMNYLPILNWRTSNYLPLLMVIKNVSLCLCGGVSPGKLYLNLLDYNS